MSFHLCIQLQHPQSPLHDTKFAGLLVSNAHLWCCPSETLQHCHIGLAVRMPSTFLVMWGGGFTWKERLFFAFAWTPKVSPLLFLQPSVVRCLAYKSMLFGSADMACTDFLWVVTVKNCQVMR